MFIPDQESRAAFQSLMNDVRLKMGRDRGGRPSVPAADAASGSGSKEARETVLRVITESRAGGRVKFLHDFRCQVCGIRLQRDDGPYAETAHIRPLPPPHGGPDKASNLLCLCPNHHILFEAGMFTIGDEFDLIGLPGKLRTVRGHPVGRKYLTYHRRYWEKARGPH